MVIVLDASVATKLFVAEPQSDAAERVVARYPLMLAPTLICVEVASALTRKVRNREIDRDIAEAALLSWQEFLELGNLRLTPDRSLLPEAAALSLTLAHPLADCLYLALAKRHSFLWSLRIACSRRGARGFRRSSPAWRVRGRGDVEAKVK